MLDLSAASAGSEPTLPWPRIIDYKGPDPKDARTARDARGSARMIVVKDDGFS
jgi:hypothetical protein